MTGKKDPEKVQLVKVRNPHGLGRREFTGEWSDHSDKWDELVWKDKKDLMRTGENMSAGENGVFWMEAAELFKLFELVTIGLLPGSWSRKDHQIDVNGTFVEKALESTDAMLEKGNNLQFLLDVNATDAELWLQLILDMPHTNKNLGQKHRMTLALYSGLTEDEKKSEDSLPKARIQELKFVAPTLPYTKPENNLMVQYYDSNGHLYGKLPGGSYLVVISYMGKEYGK